MRPDAAISATNTPFLRAIACLLLVGSAQAASLAPRASADDAAGVKPAGAQEVRSTFRFARPLPQPPMPQVLPVGIPAQAATDVDGSPHPRPRAFRGACNSTTGC